ncbi:hypothetical protein D3C76_855850 [compost metagenome]
MAKMLGQRLTLLQPKWVTLRLNMEQIQHVVDGLVENRKNIQDEHLDLYDSMAMDLLEQLESFDIFFPDLVLGEQDEPDEDEIGKLKERMRLIGAKFNLLVDSMKTHPAMHEAKLKIARAGLDDVYEALKLLFGEEEADVLTGADRP